jgi:hypothetical protein
VRPTLLCCLLVLACGFTVPDPELPDDTAALVRPGEADDDYTLDCPPAWAAEYERNGWDVAECDWDYTAAIRESEPPRGLP